MNGSGVMWEENEDKLEDPIRTARSSHLVGSQVERTLVSFHNFFFMQADVNRIIP